MKKYFSIFLVAVMCLLSVCFAASADEPISFSTEYFNDTKILSLSGTTNGSLNDMAIALIYNYIPGEGIDEDSPILADAFLLGADGVIDYEIILPNSLSGGKYIIRISASGGYLDKSFMHTNDALAPASLAVINAASEANFAQALANEGPACGLDPDLYDTYKTKIAPVLYSYKPTGGFSGVDSFLKLSNQAVAAALINSGENVSEVLVSYGNYLKEYDDEGAPLIDCLENYNLLNDTVKEEFDSVLLTTNFADKKGFCSIFRELLIFTQFENVKSWSGVKDVVLGTEDGAVINNNFDILNPDTTYYNKLKDKDEVFRNMYKDRSEVLKYADISELFAETAEDCYDAEQDTGKKSSGGGGGSSSAKTTVQTSGITTVTPSLVAGENTETNLSDIQGHWAEDSVNTLVRKNVISGYADGTFKPDLKVTRAEFVTMIVKAFNISGEEEIDFVDLSSDFWGYSSVKKAVANGIITGYEDGSFKPDEIITREQAAVIMHRALSLKITISEGSSSFVDVADISDYALRSVLDLAGLKLINGIGENLFSPLSSATRGMAAVLINNAIEFVAAQ